MPERLMRGGKAMALLHAEVPHVIMHQQMSLFRICQAPPGPSVAPWKLTLQSDMDGRLSP